MKFLMFYLLFIFIVFNFSLFGVGLCNGEDSYLVINFEINWFEFVVKDVEVVYQLLVINYFGMYDVCNLGFVKQFEKVK